MPLIGLYQTWVPGGVVGVGGGIPNVGMGVGVPKSAPAPAGAPAYGVAQTVSAVGAASGLVMAAIGAYAAANAQKHQLRSQASALEFQAQMSQINARAAEDDAQAILAAGHKKIGLVGMRYAAEKAAMRASTAGRGITLGEGSDAEVQASVSLARDIDVMTLRADTIREAGNARLRGVNERSQASAAQVSAGNMRATAKSINPGLQANTTLLGGVPLVADYFTDTGPRRGRRRF